MDEMDQNGTSSEQEKPLIAGGKAFSVQNKQQDSTGGGANEFATLFNFAKASVGSGSFALPWGILQAGLLFGSAGMILLGILSVYTMQLMLDCKNFVCLTLPPHKRKSLNYTSLGYEALGSFGKWTVNISVLVCNLGVCAGYLIFISSNLQWAFTCFAAGHSSICFTTYEIYAMVLPILILLTYLPSFRILAYAAYVGSIFLIVAMLVVYVYGFSNPFRALLITDNVQYLPPSWVGIAQWFGVTAFLFCVHSMVIPLESTMSRPRNMRFVLDIACIIVVGVNLPFAVYGYLLFAETTEGYVFENLPNGTFNDIVRLFLSIELSLTFPIVFKPASDVAEEIWYNICMFIYSLKKNSFTFFYNLYHSKERIYRIMCYCMKCLLRTLLVIVSWSVAVGIPRFELCLALVGSLATTILAFVLPPLFHLALKRRETSIHLNILHLAILVFGVAATILASGINLYMAVVQRSSNSFCEQFSNSNNSICSG